MSASVSISVIVPVYNVEQYLGECLDSLIAQTFRDFEIICVDDGSTDGSGSILSKYAAKDDRIRIFKQRNTGLGAARNHGISVATGEYVVFLDSDDCLREDALALLSQRIRESGADHIAFSASVFCDDDCVTEERLAEMRTYYRYPEDMTELVRPGPETLRSLALSKDVPVSAPLRILKRTLAEKPQNLFPVGLLHEDNYFTPMLFLSSQGTMLVNEQLYRRRVRAGSIMTGNQHAALAGGYLGVLKMLTDIGNGLPSNLQDALRPYMAQLRLLARNAYCGLPSSQRRKAREAAKLTGGNAEARSLVAPPAETTQLVSIIMPVHNTETFLGACIDSILSQTYDRFELICVDDGSTDGSLDILNGYARKDPRVKVVACQHSNAGAARNRGYAESNGTYVLFLDSDDLFDPRFIEHLVHGIESRNADIAMCRGVNFSSNSHVFRDDPTIRPNWVGIKTPRTTTDIFTKWVGWSWDKLFRRSFIDRLGLRFQEIRSTNDLSFVFTAIVCADQVADTEMPLVAHRKHHSSIESTRDLSPRCFADAAMEFISQIKRRGMLDGNEFLQENVRSFVVSFSLWHLDHMGSPAGYKAVLAAIEELFAKSGIETTDERITHILNHDMAAALFDSYLSLNGECLELQRRNETLANVANGTFSRFGMKLIWLIRMADEFVRSVRTESPRRTIKRVISALKHPCIS